MILVLDSFPRIFPDENVYDFFATGSWRGSLRTLWIRSKLSNHDRDSTVSNISLSILDPDGTYTNGSTGGLMTTLATRGAVTIGWGLSEATGDKDFSLDLDLDLLPFWVGMIPDESSSEEYRSSDSLAQLSDEINEMFASSSECASNEMVVECNPCHPYWRRLPKPCVGTLIGV